MKVLWITNTLFPEAAQLLFGKGENRGSGGWMMASAEMLTFQPDIKLYVACTSPEVCELKCVEGRLITYFVLPLGKGNRKYNKEFEPYWLNIRQQIQPNVVHIHGTEFTHGLAYVQACGNEHVVVSIQGMKSVIADYYTAGICFKDIIRNLTIHDILKGGIYSEQREYYRTGELEKDLIRSVNHVIGRTRWDKAHTMVINPDVTYHFCNESLRDVFVDGTEWNYDQCIRHSIFLSNAIYPLKGFHQVLKAMPYILQRYPDTTIRVAGNDITQYQGIDAVRHETTYWRYLKRLIKKNNLSNRITFTGSLTAEQMKQEYLQANVYVCPSSIENSPNSIGEAQVLGTPVVASFAGGIPDLMVGDECRLFRFEDTEMLAETICDVFRMESEQTNMKQLSKARHDSYENNKQLLSIYNSCIKNNQSKLS